MHAPVRVAAPQTPPVSWAEADAHLRLDGDLDQRTLVESLIDAATAHLDGWTGILGRALITQSWRQDFDWFDRWLPLPLGPVQSITSVKWQATDGTWSTVNADDYALKKDAGGRAYVRFENAYSFPSPLYEVGAVQVEYVAGEATAPAAIKTAIVMLVAHWSEHREAVATGGWSELPLGVRSLLSPYRYVSI